MTDDEKLLQALAGASFGPEASLTLPSGRRLDSDEAQAFTSMYAPAPPRSELEQELAGLKGALFLAVQRLGGRVEFTSNEIAEITESGGAWALVSWTDPATLAVIVESRKPTEEQQ